MSHHNHDESSDNANRPLAFPEKAQKLIDHWIKHNDDHASSYRQWADSFRSNGLESAAELIESAAVLTQHINATLTEALRLVELSHINESTNQ